MLCTVWPAPPGTFVALQTAAIETLIGDCFSYRGSFAARASIAALGLRSRMRRRHLFLDRSATPHWRRPATTAGAGKGSNQGSISLGMRPEGYRQCTDQRYPPTTWLSWYADGPSADLYRLSTGAGQPDLLRHTQRPQACLDLTLLAREAQGQRIRLSGGVLKACWLQLAGAATSNTDARSATWTWWHSARGQPMI